MSQQLLANDIEACDFMILSKDEKAATAPHFKDVLSHMKSIGYVEAVESNPDETSRGSTVSP